MNILENKDGLKKKMKKEKKDGWILILIMMITTAGFIFINYIRYKKLDEIEIGHQVVFNTNGGILNLKSEGIHKMISKCYSQTPVVLKRAGIETPVLKCLSPDAGFIDYLINNSEK